MTPSDLAVLIVPPAAVAVISGWLARDGFPKWANAVISGIVIALVAVISALLSNQLVGGNLWQSIAIIGALCAALVAGPLKPLQQWLTARTPSPLAALGLFRSHIVESTATRPMIQPVVSRASSAYAGVTSPRPVSLPTTSEPSSTDHDKASL